MEGFDIVGKTVECKWETLTTTQLYFKEEKIFHKTVEDDVEYWIEANAIVMKIADNLFCINLEDDAGNSFTFFLDTLSMEVKLVWTYEDGGVNSKPRHTTVSFKFID